MKRIVTLVTVVAALAAVFALPGGGHASAASPAWGDSQFVNALATCNTPPIEVSTQSAVGVFFPDAARNPRVGETFGLHIYSGDVSTCASNAVQPAIKLPTGVALVPASSAPGGRAVHCMRYASGNIANITDFTSSSSCPQSPPVVGGFLNTNIAGASSGQGWALKPSVDRAENLIEIQLIVRATTAGAKTVEGRLCDLNSNASGAPCSGSPASNVQQMSRSFTVDPASSDAPTTGGAPVAPAAPSTVENDTPFQGASTPLTLSTNVIAHAGRAGTFRGELRRLATQDTLGAIVQTGDVAVTSPGDFRVTFTFNSTQMLPGTTYESRTCFIETGGSTVCSRKEMVSTTLPDQTFTRGATTVGAKTTACYRQLWPANSCRTETTRKVTIAGTATGQRAPGHFFIKADRTNWSEYGAVIANASAARSGSLVSSASGDYRAGTTINAQLCWDAARGVTQEHLVKCGPSTSITIPS